MLQVIKQARMKWVMCGACTGERRGAHKILVGNPRKETT